MSDEEKAPEAEGMKCEISEARASELDIKIADAREYYKRSFGRELSDQEVYEMLLEVAENDKKRLFLKKIGQVTETDAIYFKEKTLGGKSNKTSKVKDSAPEGSPEADSKPAVTKPANGNGKGKNGGKGADSKPAESAEGSKPTKGQPGFDPAEDDFK